MAIEFRCVQCGKLLRTGDDTAGKQAKCPECAAVMEIPAVSESAAPPPPIQPDVLPPIGEGQAQGSFPTSLDVGDVLSRTWTIFKGHWQACITAWLIVVVINLVVSQALSQGGFVAGRALFGQHVGKLAFNLGTFVGWLVSLWLHIGLGIFMLKIARGRQAEYGDLFSGGRYFVNMLLATLLFGAICFVGILLFVVPGIIASLMLSQYFYLQIDRSVEPVESLRQSRQLTHGNKFTLFLISLAVAVIGFVIILVTFGFGALVIGPYLTLMSPVIYLTLTGQPTAEQAGMSAA